MAGAVLKTKAFKCLISKFHKNYQFPLKTIFYQLLFLKNSPKIISLKILNIDQQGLYICLNSFDKPFIQKLQ